MKDQSAGGEGMKLYYDEIDSPIGPLFLLVNENNVALRIDFGTKNDVNEKMTTWGNRYFNNYVLMKDQNRLRAIKQQIEEYFLKERETFTFDYKFFGTDFQKQVWEALFTIPYGKTNSYKDIAVIVNNPKAVRAIGGAVNKNPMSIMAPCHRVIGADGKMVGFGGGIDKKKFLLNLEK